MVSVGLYARLRTVEDVVPYRTANIRDFAGTRVESVGLYARLRGDEAAMGSNNKTQSFPQEGDEHFSFSFSIGEVFGSAFFKKRRALARGG